MKIHFVLGSMNVVISKTLQQAVKSVPIVNLGDPD